MKDGRVKPGKDGGVCGDQCRLHAIATGEVLGGEDRDGGAAFRLYEEYFGVIGGEIHMLHRLADERPKAQCLLRSLKVQDQIKLRDPSLLLDEEQAAQELLGDGERRLPHLGASHL